MAKRHKWSRRNGWTVCDDCGCRYRHGNIQREYEQPDGVRTLRAEECIPMPKRTDTQKRGEHYQSRI